MKYLEIVNDYANYFYDVIVELNRVDRLTNPDNFKFKLYTIKELIVIMKDDPIFDHLIVDDRDKPVDIFEGHGSYNFLRNVRKKSNPYFTCKLNNVCIFYYEIDRKLKQRMQLEYRNFILERLLIAVLLLLLISFLSAQL